MAGHGKEPDWASWHRELRLLVDALEDTPNRPLDRLAELRRLQRLVVGAELPLIAAARAAGKSWGQVGAALDVSRGAIASRYLAAARGPGIPPLVTGGSRGAT